MKGRPPKIGRYKKELRSTFPSERERRPPKLQRFCATGGLLDYNVAAKMSEGELCEEAVKVIGHNARGLARDVYDMGGGLCKVACGIIGGIFGFIETVVDACK